MAIKQAIDTQQFEIALAEMKADNHDTSLSDTEFLLLSSFFMTESGQTTRAIEFADKAEFSTIGYKSQIAEARSRALYAKGDLVKADEFAVISLSADPKNIMSRLTRLRIESDLTNDLLATSFEQMLERTNGAQVVWMAYLDQAFRLAEPDIELPDRALGELGDIGLAAEYQAKFSFKAKRHYEAYRLFERSADLYQKEGNSIAFNRVSRWLDLNGKYSEKSNEEVSLNPSTKPVEGEDNQEAPQAISNESPTAYSSKKTPVKNDKTSDQPIQNRPKAVAAQPEPIDANSGQRLLTQKEQSDDSRETKASRRMIKPAAQNQTQDVEPLKVVTRGEISTGSGFITNSGKWVITNRHVVENADRILVRNGIGKISHVTDFKFDENEDIALLYLEEPYPKQYSVDINDIINPAGGDELFVMGYPLTSVLGTHYPSITEGIVSKEAGFDDTPNHFLVTAKLNQGNSGGPIFSRDGRLFGIAVAKLDKVKMQAETGLLPEDVNVGIKGSELRRFLGSRDTPNLEARPALTSREAYSELRARVVLVVSIDD